MKKYIYPLVFSLCATFSYSQYFYIAELESENQSETLDMFDMWMSATKDVMGKDLNMVTFQKELSNTHFFVRVYESLQQWVDEDNMSDKVGAQVFQKLSGVENIQEKFTAMQKATDFKGARLFELVPELSNMSPYFEMSAEEKKEYEAETDLAFDSTKYGFAYGVFLF